MSTEAAIVNPTDTSSAPPAAFEPVISETKTDAERDYFKSRGEKSEGLFSPAPGKTPDAKAPATNGNGKHEPEAAGDAMEDGEITINAEGKAIDTKTGRFVPRSAFLRVKDEAKTAKGEAQTLRENLIQARERLSILTEVLPKGEEKKAVTKPEDAPEPDPEQDIFAHNKWLRDQALSLKAELAAMRGETNKDRERTNLQQFFQSDVAKFTKDNADFTDALNHGIQVRHKMLEAVGVADEAQRQKMVLGEIHDLIKESHGQNKSVAEKLYNAAKALGYTKKASAQDADKSTEALAEIERINTAQKSNKTLGNGSGGGVAVVATVEKYTSMGESEGSAFRSAFIAKNGSAAWRDFIAGRR